MAVVNMVREWGGRLGTRFVLGNASLFPVRQSRWHHQRVEIQSRIDGEPDDTSQIRRRAALECQPRAIQGFDNEEREVADDQ